MTRKEFLRELDNRKMESESQLDECKYYARKAAQEADRATDRIYELEKLIEDKVKVLDDLQGCMEFFFKRKEPKDD